MEKSNKVIGVLVSLVLGTALAGSHDLPGPAQSDAEVQIAWPQEAEAHVLLASGVPVGCVTPPQERIFMWDFEAGWGDWWSDLGVWEVGAQTSGPSGLCMPYSRLSIRGITEKTWLRQEVGS